MTAKAKEPTHFIVGTNDMVDGEHYDVFADVYEARDKVTELIKDGFHPSKIVWIQGVKLPVTASTYIEVESIQIG